jgi:ubiquinone/menaquinone biosynthesis C-methylase UbiE
MTYKETTKESYQATAKEFAHKVAELAPLGSIEKFMKFLPSQPAILDLGCGSGRDAKIFSGLGAKVVGIDYCSNLLAIAKETAPLAEFYEMDFEAINFPAGSFDGAWAACSLVHVPKKSILAVLTNVHSILKNNGYFYLTLKRGSGEILEKDERYGDIEKFWAFYEEEEITNILQKAKFNIVEMNIVEKKHAYQTHPFLVFFCRKMDEK